MFLAADVATLVKPLHHLDVYPKDHLQALQIALSGLAEQLSFASDELRTHNGVKKVSGSIQ